MSATEHDERLWALAADFLMRLEDAGWSAPDEERYPDAWGLAREHLAGLLLAEATRDQVKREREDEEHRAQAQEAIREIMQVMGLAPVEALVEDQPPRQQDSNGPL